MTVKKYLTKTVQRHRSSVVVYLSFFFFVSTGTLVGQHTTGRQPFSPGEAKESSHKVSTTRSDPASNSGIINVPPGKQGPPSSFRTVPKMVGDFFSYLLENFFGQEHAARVSDVMGRTSSQPEAMKEDSMAFVFSRKDNNGIIRYNISGTLISRPDELSFRLSDSLVLNYQQWTVDSQNNIRITPQGISVTRFSLAGDSALVTAASQRGTPNSAIDIQVSNFDIRNILELLKKDTLLATGRIDARINVSEFYKCLPAILGEIELKNLVLLNSPVGNLHLTTQRQQEDAVYTQLQLTNNGNNINLAGNYFLNNEQEQLDAILDIKPLQLASLQGVLKKYLQAITGTLSGQILLKGQLAQPQWSGELLMDSALIATTHLGTAYAIDKQKIMLDYPSVRLAQFTVHDSLKNSLVMNGTLGSRSLAEYDLDLQIKSRGFELLNVQKAINNQLYGLAAIDADVSVSGTLAAPIIKGDIQLGKKTSLIMLLPERSVDKDAARSVVSFIDRDTFALQQTAAFRTLPEPVIDYTASLNKQLQVYMGKEATLTIVIEPSSGDELTVNGLAKLNPGMDSADNFLLSGAYAIESGYYMLNSQFLNKRFDLLKGSTILFNDRPVNAQINIRAEYIANTSPQDLLGNEVGLVDKKLAQSFKQKIPFRVRLSMTGNLNKPRIRFDILLPEEKLNDDQLERTIENKLLQLRSDVAATNKQVFALLALDRFVGEQSTDFFKGSGDGFNDLARESVSNFLSSALDEIASDLFKGINVDLNLNSYKDFILNSGGKTKDLTAEVSKNFLDDRLNVVVGKNFGIEGQDGSAKAAQQKGSRFLPDVTVNYKLSKDGKYMLRAFNKNQFEVILDGYIVETGLAFIVTLDYDLFDELFTSIKKKGNE